MGRAAGLPSRRLLNAGIYQQMSESEVISNQKPILKNHKAILSTKNQIKTNQETIKKNEASILKNQTSLNTIIKNQGQILTLLKNNFYQQPHPNESRAQAVRSSATVKPISLMKALSWASVTFFGSNWMFVIPSG
ncbi:MAG: hypothetical protein WB630_12050 [Candidatus Acidiferrales bacterium]